jgi:Uma2 family endonuclease
MLQLDNSRRDRVSMAHIARIPSNLSANEFLSTDQRAFGDAWRYELIEGEIVAHATPSPRHGRILAGLMRAIGNRLSGNKNGCYPESGSGAVPEREQSSTARIPDAMIRCRELPRVTFEIISPSELKDWQARDKKRRDVQDVESVNEIVEIYQEQLAVHVYRKGTDGKWDFQSEGGDNAVLNLFADRERLSIPLSEIYEFAMPSGSDRSSEDE